MSVSARNVWLIMGVIALLGLLMVVLPFVGLGYVFGRSPVREFEALKRNVDPQQLQSWAVEMLRQFPYGTNAVLYNSHIPLTAGYGERRLVISNAPAFFCKIPAFGALGPEIMISRTGPEAERSVDLAYFYGGWGNGQTIVVGSPAFTRATNSHCIRWVPGVYYFVW